MPKGITSLRNLRGQKGENIKGTLSPKLISRGKQKLEQTLGSNKLISKSTANISGMKKKSKSPRIDNKYDI